jgi:Lar family restriction alleviation protein
MNAIEVLRKLMEQKLRELTGNPAPPDEVEAAWKAAESLLREGEDILEGAAMSELKPCPFCGSADVVMTENDLGWPVGQCDDCGAAGPCIRANKNKARSEWNRRALQAETPDEIIERSRGLLQRAVYALSMHAADAGIHHCYVCDLHDEIEAFLKSPPEPREGE